MNVEILWYLHFDRVVVVLLYCNPRVTDVDEKRAFAINVPCNGLFFVADGDPCGDAGHKVELHKNHGGGHVCYLSSHLKKTNCNTSLFFYTASKNKSMSNNSPVSTERVSIEMSSMKEDFVVFQHENNACIGVIESTTDEGKAMVRQIGTDTTIELALDALTPLNPDIARLVLQKTTNGIRSHHKVEEEIKRLSKEAQECDTDVQDDYIRIANELINLRKQLAPRRVYKIDEDLPRKSKYCSSCCEVEDDSRSNEFRRNVRRVINLLNISPRKKAILLDRYVSLVEEYAKTKKYFTYTYNAARITTTLCGIITPALVSIQPLFGANAVQNPVYWSTWGTSLLSGIVSGYIALFKLDRKFYSTTKAYLRLEGEGWAYLTLSGKYANVSLDGDEPTHANRFTMFCNEVESIRRGEVSVDMSGSTSDDRSRTQKSSK